MPIRSANFCGQLLRSTFAVHFCGPLLRSTFAVNFCGPSKVTNVGTLKRPGRHGHFWFRTISLTFGNFEGFSGLYLEFWESVKKCACTHHPPSEGFQNLPKLENCVMVQRAKPGCRAYTRDLRKLGKDLQNVGRTTKLCF